MIGTLLFILFIFFIVIPLFKILWRVWQFSRGIKDARRRMDDAFRASASAPRGGHGPARPARKKKKIDPDVGEYVAFEEVSVSQSHTASGPTPGQPSGMRAESQVEDAVWEEIK